MINCVVGMWDVGRTSLDTPLSNCDAKPTMPFNEEKEAEKRPLQAEGVKDETIIERVDDSNTGKRFLTLLSMLRQDEGVVKFTVLTILASLLQVAAATLSTVIGAAILQAIANDDFGSWRRALAFLLMAQIVLSISQ